jgi:hypothetical protein
LVTELEEVDHLIGRLAQAGVGRAEQPGHHVALMLLAGEDQIFPHRQFWKYLEQLERAADAEPVQVGRPESGHDLAIDLHLAAIRLELAEDAVEQCRLATTVRADQAEDFSLLDIEAHAIDRGDAAEILLDVADLENRGHGAGSSPDLATARSADAALVRRSVK